MARQLLIIMSSLYLIPTLLCDRLGRQSGIQHRVETVNGFLPPSEFFQNYVLHQKPVIFKGAAKTLAAYDRWTDEYLKSLPGAAEFKILVEERSKESSMIEAARMTTFLNFLNNYNEEDIYCIHTLPDFLRHEMPLFPPIDCPELVDLVEDGVLWFSSGDTQSDWHNDAYENINCLLRGKKEFIMANLTEGNEKVYVDWVEGFSWVDCYDVDLEKFPTLAQTEFYNATLEEGDCLYVPFLWFHAVTSFGSNVALNQFWRTYRTQPPCEASSSLTLANLTLRGEPSTSLLDLFNMVEMAHQQLYRNPVMYGAKSIGWDSFEDTLQLVKELYREKGKGTDSYDDIWRTINYSKDNPFLQGSDEGVRELFKKLDSDGNNRLDYSEIDSILKISPSNFLKDRLEDRLEDEL